MMAVRGYKRPELYQRLNNEGVRDRERGLMNNVLKATCDIVDNVYQLKRRIWNDVNEDWAFYTEQDKQCLKRRKPANLTPPLSSDGGSSTSGQSPTSTHNGSPPPPVKRPSLLSAEKYSDAHGPSSKKPRISHCSGTNAASASAAPATATVAAGPRARLGVGNNNGGSSSSSNSGYGSHNGSSSNSNNNNHNEYHTASSASMGPGNSRMMGSNSNGMSVNGGGNSAMSAMHKQNRRPVVDSRESANLNPRSRESQTSVSSAGSSTGSNSARVNSPASGYFR